MTDTRYKIAIVGGGAVGLTYASFLASVADVLVKTRRPEQAELIKTQGVRIFIDDKEEVITGIAASSDMSTLANYDAIILTVKSYDTEQIAQELNKVIGSDTVVLTIQNGIQAFGVLHDIIGNPDRVFAGVTYIGASRVDDRTIKLGNNRRTVIDSKAAKLVDVFQRTRFGVESSPDIMQTVWDKMVLNTGQNALSALTNLSLGEMLKSPYCLDIASHLLAEFEQVANAVGVTFDYSLMDKLKDNWTMSNFYPSMWQDLHKGNKTEIDAINGAISKLGQDHNLATPYNDMITSLIKTLEDHV